jgi:hypothetical protein
MHLVVLGICHVKAILRDRNIGRFKLARGAQYPHETIVAVEYDYGFTLRIRDVARTVIVNRDVDRLGHRPVATAPDRTPFAVRDIENNVAEASRIATSKTT